VKLGTSGKGSTMLPAFLAPVPSSDRGAEEVCCDLASLP
jgi:hypothetical protein